MEGDLCQSPQDRACTSPTPCEGPFCQNKGVFAFAQRFPNTASLPVRGTSPSIPALWGKKPEWGWESSGEQGCCTPPFTTRSQGGDNVEWGVAEEFETCLPALAVPNWAVSLGRQQLLC